MSAPAPKEKRPLTQMARSLLSQLDGEGSSLRITDTGHCLKRDSGEGGSGRIAEDVLRFCLQQDFLERRGDDLMLSATGRAWLRRISADDDAFRSQHQLREVRLKEIEGTTRSVLVNDAESPLGWLRSRKDRNGRPLIASEQFEAGERLRADYWFAQLSPRVTANWSALAPSGRLRRAAPSDAASLRDEVIAAKDRVRRAIEAVGPELSGVLVDVCCELKGLEQAERDKGWPQRAGKVVLQLALTRLARHYGIGATAPSRNSRLRHWGSEDYRPNLDAWRNKA